MVRTMLMGILALAALGAVLAAVFLIGLARIKLADHPDPAAPVFAPATQPATTAPAPPLLAIAPPDALPPVSIEAIEFPAEKARLSGGLKLDKDAVPERSHSHHRPGSPPEDPPAIHQAITNFHDESDSAEWAATVTKPGLYEVDLVYASQGPRDKAESCVLTVGDQDLHADTLHTRGRDTYQVLTVGNLTLAAGNLTVRFHLSEKSRGSQLRLRTIRLIPAA